MDTSDYRMAMTEPVLRRGLERCGDDLILTLDPAFQGLPDTAHGGSLLAVFQLLAEGTAPTEVRGVYRRRVPLGVPLRLTTTRADGTLACHLRDTSNTTLAEGAVEVLGSGVAGLLDEGAPAPGASGHPLPVSSTCLACGVDNALGLQAQLRFDESMVWSTWPLRESFRVADGALAPLAVTTLLDEAAFWLGALASGESGMTTELVVTLHVAPPTTTAITVAGRRDRVRQRTDDPRYWDTEVTARDADGRLVADARITFVAVRGSARRLTGWLLKTNAPAVVQRVFPAYAG